MSTAPARRPRLSRHGWRYVTGRVVHEFWLGGGPDLAAKLTFFTVMSFAPTILAIYSLATLVLANNAELVESLIADFIAGYVPGEYQESVRGVLEMVIGSQRGGVVGVIVGVAVALWSASAYVRAFSRTANTVYGQPEGRSIPRLWATMFLLTFALLVGMVGILVSVMLNETVVNATLGLIAEPLGLGGTLDFLLGVFLPVWRWVKWPVILGLATVLIAVLYYFTPNVRQARFRWLSVGAFIALLGLALVSVGFWLYLSYLSSLSSYGAIGTILAFMFVLWGFNMMLVLGMKVDVEVERARQLKEGRKAEREIHLPPRSTRQVERTEAMQERLEERGRDLRKRYLAD
ncbi:MAG: YihY/virulence factor BrkB family protein [Corynebacterium humireducens]|jgi:membrane protein|uniref:YihY/virulence factor BrkB family protein n=1 Tax=Corynebacterium humireducens TaxID=1223514 RepID=A0A7X6PQ66_9CORY|nr:YihY/virulence factor BrkB family protein [Corynebacterium humireducens]